MKINIVKIQPIDRACTDLYISVEDFISILDLHKQMHSTDSVLTLLERKAKELARQIEVNGPAAFMGWKG